MQRSQSLTPNSKQFQNNLSTGDPDDIIVNTAEQEEPVNPQDPEALEISKQESEQKEKGYREGTRNDTDEKTQAEHPI